MRTRSAFVLMAIISLSALSIGCGKSGEAVPETVPDAAGMELGNQLMGAFTDAGSVLGSITDEASAQESVAGLDAINAELDALSTQANDASPETKAGLSEVATAQIPGFKELTEKAYAIPGVKPVVQPPLDSMLAKFSLFM